jgi:AraC-like DNA-binding protein
MTSAGMSKAIVPAAVPWRVQLAARMLADGATKVAAVAREVGFESEAAFSRTFKRVSGVTPSAWRKRGQLQDTHGSETTVQHV